MSVAKIIKESRGSWVGTMTLRLAWGPDQIETFQSNSKLVIEIPEHDSFANLRYRWSHEQADRYGEMLICGPTVAWCDTFHQCASVMHLLGEGEGFKVTGNYTWEGSPPWGWRIEITNPTPDSLLLEMTNISPEGEEELAVRAQYRRS